MKLIVCVAALVVAFFFGAFVGHQGVFPSIKPAVSSRPAYLLASWDVLHPEKLKPFGDAIAPLVRKVGMEFLAGSKPEVLEGSWPYKGVLILERYDSMQALLNFWRSPENRAAQKLREGPVDSEFIVAVEAKGPTEQH